MQFVLNILNTFRDILSSPKLIGFLLVPVVVAIVSYPGFVFLFYVYRLDIASLLVSDAWYPRLLGGLVVLLGLLISGVLSFIISSVLGSFFIESAIEEVHKTNGLKIQTPQNISSWIKSLIRSIRDSAIQLSVLLILGLLTIILGVVPFLAFIPVLIGAFLLGYGFFDLPLALLQIGFIKRFKMARSHKLELLITGGLFSMALCIPFGGLLLFPVFYLVAARTIASWPELQAELKGQNQSSHA